jgi:hypothetical protein
LEKACDVVPTDNTKTAPGDFNAKVVKESSLYPACGGHILHNETNDNGKRMLNFALGMDLDVMETWYQNKDIHKVTWQQNM